MTSEIVGGEPAGTRYPAGGSGGVCSIYLSIYLSVLKRVLDGSIVGQVKLRVHFWEAVSDYHTSKPSPLASVTAHYTRVVRDNDLRGSSASYKYSAWLERKSTTGLDR